MYSCKVRAKFSSVSNRKQIPYYSRNIPLDFNGRFDDQWVCGIPFSKTWAALHAIVFHHWLSASVWGGLQMTQQHSAREVERMSHSPVCACVCVFDRQRDWGQMSALCCAAGPLCSSCTCAVRTQHLAEPYYPQTVLLHQWRMNGPCPASLFVCVFHNLTTDAFQVNECLCVCDQTPYLSGYHSFVLFVAYPSLIITAFCKSYSSYGNCIRKHTVCANSRFA